MSKNIEIIYVRGVDLNTSNKLNALKKAFNFKSNSKIIIEIVNNYDCIIKENEMLKNKIKKLEIELEEVNNTIELFEKFLKKMNKK
ncbi:hypothetical protein V3471_15015 [Flavobacterium oreochromis]|uniref:hypothetical protein n=1 Tax=Flavobacterium oreochromis TaxID=2906078 RepID=UPI00385F0B0A